MRAAVKIRAVSAYLTHFDAPEPANDPHESVLATETHEPSAPGPKPPVPAESVGVIAETEPPPGEVEDARSTEIEAMIEARIAAVLEQEHTACETRLLLAREAWVNETAGVLASQMNESIEAAFATLRDDMARALTPFIAQEVFSHTFEHLLASIKKGLAGETDPTIEIFAPADLIEKLKHRLSDYNIAIIAHETDGADVRVQMGVTSIETSLQEWTARLMDNGRGVS